MNDRSFSMSPYSCLKMSSHNGTAFFSSSMSSLGAVSTASASRGMALRMFPPCHSAKRAPKFAIASRTKRASSLLAFARPSFISNPECPPFNPESSTFIATSSRNVGTSLYSSSAVTFTPPALPIITCPSVSSSKLRRMRPCKVSACRLLTPYMQVSSSTVSRASSGPCFRVSSSITAITVATPIPSSEPRVVPLAFTQSPSI